MNEVLGATPSWMMRWGSLLLLGAIALLLLVSAFIKYPDVIPGRTSIVPLSDRRYAVTALIPAAGSGKVRPGQQVIIKLDSYPAAEFGSISGTVSSRPQAAAANMVSVVIRLDHGLLTNYHEQLDIYKKEEGQAEIITAEKRLIQRIFSFFR